MISNNEWIVSRITGARFTPVRLREGYDMGEVDRLLAQVVEDAGRSEPTVPPGYQPRGDGTR